MDTANSTQLWTIIDIKTGAQVGSTYTSRKRARTRADRLDAQYGAYRYSVQPAK